MKEISEHFLGEKQRVFQVEVLSLCGSGTYMGICKWQPDLTSFRQMLCLFTLDMEVKQ